MKLGIDGQKLPEARKRGPLKSLEHVKELGLGGILIGFVCLIVPGIILALMWSMIGPIAVVEGKGIIATFRRSKELTTGALRDIFLVIAVITVGTSIFNVPLPFALMAP